MGRAYCFPKPKIFTAFESEIISELSNMKVMLREMRKEQVNIKKLVQKVLHQPSQEAGLPDEIQFPLTSIEALEGLEDLLQDSALQRRVVSKRLLHHH